MSFFFKRSRLAAVNAQASNIQCDVTALSSSEGSLYSGCCQSAASGSDGETDALDSTYGTCFSPPTSAVASSGPPAHWYKSPRNVVVKTGHVRSAPDSADSVYGTLQAAVRKMSSGEQEIKEQLVKQQQQQQQQPPLIQRKKPSSSSSSRQELRKRLQEVKLTSESGNASVIEVIEPSSSEADDDDVLDGRTPRDQSTPLRGNNTRSFNASFSEELERARQNKRAGVMMMAENFAKSADPLCSNKALAEPDLLAGTITVASSSSRSCHDLALRVEQLDQPEDEAEVNHSTRSHSSLSSSNNTAVTSVAAGPRKKSGGFLTKFALKARWPSKRKSSPAESPSLTAASPTEPESPDLSLGDSPSSHREEESTSSTAGVVAGLSQMFEDMSTGIKSPTKPQVVQLMTNEKRVGSHSPSRNSLAGPPVIESDGSRSKSTLTAAADESQVMDLPPSTSPPPVPLEIETYNSSPSSQETSSSCSANGPPPPPPRFSKSSSESVSSKVSASGAGVVGGATPSSSASSSTSASHGGVESLSVAASEDSGIVMARPASSASKSDSSPRPAPSSYSFTTFSPLRKATLTTTTVTQDSTHGERLSPAPSDKTESASASDLSKTESMRHFRQLARIEEAGAVAAAVIVQDGQDKPTSVDLSAQTDSANVELAHQSGQILTWREAKLKNQVVTPPPLEERLNKVTKYSLGPYSII